MQLNDFKPKHVQGLYSYYHFEAPNGAWFQRSIDLARKEITYCASEGAEFLKFPSLRAFDEFLANEAEELDNG